MSADERPVAEPARDLTLRVGAFEGPFDLLLHLCRTNEIDLSALPVRAITKRLLEGHPNVLDAIEQGWVGAVINTVSGRRGPLKDGVQIRRAAVERRITCFTSIDTARVAVEAVTRQGSALKARPLAEYVAGRPQPEESVRQGVS